MRPPIGWAAGATNESLESLEWKFTANEEAWGLELPELSRKQRTELSLRLLEMDCTQDDAADLAACEQAALFGFAMLDEMEAENPTP